MFARNLWQDFHLFLFSHDTNQALWKSEKPFAGDMPGLRWPEGQSGHPSPLLPCWLPPQPEPTLHPDAAWSLGGFPPHPTPGLEGPETSFMSSLQDEER